MPEASVQINSLLAAYRNGQRVPVDTVRAIYARIAAAGDNPVWITLLPQAEVLARAEALAATGSPNMPLYGIPFAVKDNIDVAAVPTTAACPAFAYTPAKHATAVQKLIDAGAILVGKTNLDQFATGLSGARSPYGVVRNAIDSRYISGGSSSGSAVAVALDLVSFALGTDTAGSGRVPAAFNNIVGLKPTRGRVSTAGVVPACRSLDCVSVFARTVEDTRSVLSVIEGPDRKDDYSRTPPAVTATHTGGLRFGVLSEADREWHGDEDSARCYRAAIARMERLGGTAVPVSFKPFHEVAQLLYGDAFVAERYTAIKPFFDSHSEALLPVTRDIIGRGVAARAAEVFGAQQRLQSLRREIEPLWNTLDYLLLPTAPTHYTLDAMLADPVTLNSRLGHYTNFVNLLDLCALALPAGTRADGLPFGISLIAPAWQDERLLQLGAAWQADRLFPALAATAPVHATTKVAVVGAHLAGQPLNDQLTQRAATLERAVRSAARYRLYALANTTPPKPGLVRVEEGGACIELEVWSLPLTEYGSFVAGIPAPLGIGMLELEDGEQVQGFLCEPYALDGAIDITSYGGWRRYLASRK